MITLYNYWRSTAAYRIRIALHWKNIPFQTNTIHLMNNGGEQHSDAYKSINASQLVPTLELECGRRISQSIAILQYLEDTYPNKPLLPLNPWIKYQAIEIATIIGCDVHPLNNVRILQYLGNILHIEQKAKDDWYQHWIHTGFTAIEKKLELWQHSGPFALGNTFSWADIFIAAQVYNAERFNIRYDHLPRLTASYTHTRTLQAVEKAFPNQNIS